MPLTSLAPTALPAQTGRRWSLAVSVALHIVAVAFSLRVERRAAVSDGAPSYELVFEAPSTQPETNRPPGLPQMQRADIPLPDDVPLGIPATTPQTLPDPASAPPPPAEDAAPPQLAAAEPAPAPVPAAESPPATTPPAESTPAVAPATAAPPATPSSQLAFAPEAAPPVTPEPAPVPQAATPTEEPSVNLELPRIMPTPSPLDARPVTPPPAPAQPQPRPTPPAPPRPASRPSRQSFATLSNPLDLNFGPARPPPAARGSVASRAIDLSPPPPREGPSSHDPYAQIRAANASADWNRGLLQYWLRHRYYPQQAAANGEEGQVTIQLTVNRSGRVEDVRVLSKSGSQWLDMAALGTFRNAQLPAFTNEMREDRITFPIPITYYLIR